MANAQFRLEVVATDHAAYTAAQAKSPPLEGSCTPTRGARHCYPGLQLATSCYTQRADHGRSAASRLWTRRKVGDAPTLLVNGFPAVSRRSAKCTSNTSTDTERLSKRVGPSHANAQPPTITNFSGRDWHKSALSDHPCVVTWGMVRGWGWERAWAMVRDCSQPRDNTSFVHTPFEETESRRQPA